MPNTVPMITNGCITRMTGLPDRPVYFLHLNGAAMPNLVVKGEAGGTALRGHATDDEALTSITWGSKLMKNVNNKLVNIKRMAHTEILEFTRIALLTFDPGSPQYNNVDPNATIKYNWVKMPYISGLSGGDFWAPDPDIERMLIVVRRLWRTVVWYELGKVLAVDIFNGNEDRFTLQGVWMNRGNLLFLEDVFTPVIGLDVFDPNSPRSNLVTGGKFKGLKILTDYSMRLEYAHKCTRGVGAELKAVYIDRRTGHKSSRYVPEVTLPIEGERSVKIDKLEELFSRFAPWLARGIHAGALELKAYLQRKVAKYDQQSKFPVLPPAPQIPGQLGSRSGAPRQLPAPPPGMPVPVGAQLQPPLPGMAKKEIPKAVLARMKYLGW